MNYKLRKDLSINVGEVKLYRIEAIKDIPSIGVKKGEIGGYIEKEANLSGNAWVYVDAMVYGDAWISGNALVYGGARISGNAWVYENARVHGNSKICGNAMVSGNAWVSGDVVSKKDDVYNITSNSQYNITITPNYIRIGCEYHTKDEWFSFKKKDILRMGGDTAWTFWKKWKPILRAICKKG